MAENKFKRFQSVYTDSNTNSGDNYLTDKELGESPILPTGIPYQAAATSDILNALLRQVTAITTTVAELIATEGKTEVSSLSTDANLLTGLKNAVNALADARIKLDKLDRTTATALSTSDTNTKLVSERTVAHAIKNNLTTTAEGFLLDASRGKALSDAITAEVTARGNAITNITKPDGVINARIKDLNASIAVKQILPVGTEDAYTKADTDNLSTLYIWRGTQKQWNKFSGLAANSALLPNVLTIITD